MKKITLIALMVLLASLVNIYSLHYYSNDFYFSVDVPNNWELYDETYAYDVVFKNDKSDAFAEVIVLDLTAATDNADLLQAYIERFNMKGSSKNTIFCQYDAIRGDYTLNVEGVALQMDIVIFKDNYFYYVVMGYGKTGAYKNRKLEIYNVVQSTKIYYDNDVVYSNDANTEVTNNNDQATNDNNDLEDDKADTETKYPINVKWDKYNKTFQFFESDYKAAVKEMDKITNPSYWQYFNIDWENDPNYEITLWHKFYQEIYNKNFTRVNDLVEWFKTEAKAKNWDSYQLAENVMKSIQVIPYERPYNIITDKNRGENKLDFLPPNEVAKYNKGDCDTKSMFIITILKRLGYDMGIYLSFDYGHAMVGINIPASGTAKTYNGKKYYFIESTYPGWRIGDLPPQMNDVSKWNFLPIK